jgi:hypothetical protein
VHDPRPQRPWPKGLLALNAFLLLVLAAVTLAPGAHAQAGGRPTARARGEYTMVSGRIVGGNSHAVYVVDTTNQEMLALLWNQSSRALDVIGYRNLSADAAAQPTR